MMKVQAHVRQIEMALIDLEPQWQHLPFTVRQDVLALLSQLMAQLASTIVTKKQESEVEDERKD